MNASGNAAPLLIEIGSEEIPAGVVGNAARWLHEQVAQLTGLAADQGQYLYTPRRMISYFPQVVLRQPDRHEVAMGPALKAARSDDGHWTRAAEGFAKGQGVAMSDLEVLDTPKGQYIAAKKTIVGKPTSDLLAEALPRLLRQMPLPKRMRWGTEREAFVRPVHWLVALLGNLPIEFEFAGMRSGTTSQGHRFYHPGPVEATAELPLYKLRLREAQVIVDPEERKSVILQGIDGLCREVGGVWRQDFDTLDIVVNLTESPRPLLGTFDPGFLEIPPEVIFTTLRENQKLFTINDQHGKLTNRFIAVANTLSEASRSVVAAGNARVVSARLADARFFYREDVRTPLAERVAGLGDRIWLAGMGSIGEKVKRIESLATGFAEQLCPGAVGQVARAAYLCKADLATRMVFEFPELQGVIGGYYARADGEEAAVAEAIASHYQPRFAADAIPATVQGQMIALADKLDSIAGCFGLGLVPSGTQDPYALRRAALGVLRILAEGGHALPLSKAVAQAVAALPETVRAGKEAAIAAQILDFFRGRLASLHAADHPVDAVDAVLEAGFDAVGTIAPRLQALADLRAAADFVPLAAAFKRVGNLVRKSAGDGDLGAEFDAKLCEKQAELDLHHKLDSLAGTSATRLAAGDFAGAMRLLAQVKPEVDAFFDGVMVMVDDAAVRRNRVALLGRCAALFAQIADFSKLQG